MPFFLSPSPRSWQCDFRYTMLSSAEILVDAAGGRDLDSHWFYSTRTTKTPMMTLMILMRRRMLMTSSSSTRRPRSQSNLIHAETGERKVTAKKRPRHNVDCDGRCGLFVQPERETNSQRMSMRPDVFCRRSDTHKGR